MTSPAFRRSIALTALAVPALLLAACDRNPLVVRRSSCPAVAVAAQPSPAASGRQPPSPAA